MSESLIIEQRAVIRFLMRKAKKGKEIHQELVIVYGDDALPFSIVQRWITQFRAGRESFENDHSPGLLKLIIKGLIITILTIGIACNIFLTIPHAVEHKAVHFYNRYYQDVLSTLLYICTIFLLFISVEERNATLERRNLVQENALGNRELAEHPEPEESRYADAKGRAAINDVVVADHQQDGEILADAENPAVTETHDKKLSSHLFIFAILISVFGGLSCILLAIGKSLMFKFGCYSIILIDISLPGFVGKFISDVVFIVASAVFFLICPLYVRHLSKVRVDINRSCVYYFINLFLALVIWLQFAKMVSFEAEDNIDRLNKSNNHTLDDCYFFNQTTKRPMFLYAVYPYIEKFAFSFAVKSLPVLFLIIEDLKKNHHFGHPDDRIQLRVHNHGFMKESSRVTLITVIALGVLVLLSSSVAFSIIFWSNPVSNLAKSGLTSISCLLLTAIAGFMLSRINYNHLNNQQIAATWNSDPDVLILMYSFLPVVFQLGCSFIAGWINLFSPTHPWFSKSSTLFYITYQFCDLIEVWTQYYLAKWMIIVNEKCLNFRPSPVIIFGSFVFFVTNILFAIDTLNLMTHVINTTTPLSSLLNNLAYAIMISITMPANVLFRSRLVGMFLAFFGKYWWSFTVDCFGRIKNSCRRYRTLPEIE